MIDLATMAERLAVQEAGQQRTRADALEDLARRLAWGGAADKKSAAEVERLCSTADEVRALERRVAGLRRLREVQPLAARALQLAEARRETERRHVAAIAEHREHGRHAAARLASDPTLSAAEVEQLRRLACYPDPAPVRQADAAAAEAERALGQVLELVPGDVAQAYRDAVAALVRTKAEPARLQRELAELVQVERELARAGKAYPPVTVKDLEPYRSELVPGLSADHAAELGKDALLQALKAEAQGRRERAEAELGSAPKLVELARQKHRAAFQAVVTWGRA